LRTRLLVLAIVAVLIIIALGIYLIYQGAPMYQQVYRTPQTQTTALGLRQIELRLRDYSFDPNTIVLKPGERVSIILVNEGRYSHTFTIDALGIDISLSPGERKTIDITAPSSPGSYTFYCKPHRGLGMTGNISVIG